MKIKIRRLPYFLAFFATGFSLLLGLSLTNMTKDVHSVSAEDNNNYFLTGTMNGWDVQDETYPLEKIGDYQFKFEGLLDGGAAYVKFKITGNGTWDPQYGYDNLDDESKPLFNNDNGDIEIGARNTGLVLVLDTLIHKINATYELYTLTNIVQCSTDGIDPNHMRVWLDRGGYEVAGALNALQYGPTGTLTDESTIWEASGYEKLFDDGEGNVHWLAYFDIPIANLSAGMDVRVVRVSNKRDVIWNRTAIHVWTVGDNNKVLYIGEGWDDATLTTGIIGDDKEIPVDFLIPVLEGYLTCSDSAINGYGAFPEMSRTFFEKDDGEFKIVGMLGDITIDDYADKDLTYTGGRVKTVTGWDKYTRMEMMYQASVNGSSTFTQLELFTNKQSVTMVLVISLIGLTSLFGLHFLKKRKTI